jgi:hypothetical protein
MIEGLDNIWMGGAMRTAEAVVFERPSWITDSDWQGLIARLRAAAADEEQRIDKERCAEALRRRRDEDAEAPES